MADGVPYGRRLTDLADAHPDQAALHFAAADGRDHTVSWGELERRSNQMAGLLAGHGVGQDDVVAVGLVNSLEHVYTTFAAWKLGASVLPLRWDLPAWEVGRLLGIADATAVVADWDEGPDGVISSDHVRATDSLPAEPPPDRIPGRARMTASSGSTGRPKLIVGSEAGVYRPPDEGSGLKLGSGEGRETYLTNSPLYHVNGFAFCYSPLLAGELVVLMERFDAVRVVDVIERYGVQHAAMVPTMLMRIARLPDVGQRDLSSLERLVYGGASIPDWVVRAWLELIPPERFMITYGGSEGIGLCATTGDQWLRHPGTCGQPLDCEVRILDADGTELAVGEVGEIHLRKHEEDGSFRYVGQETPAPTADGFRTYGDLGYVNGDGFVFVVDRRHDLIVSGGANVFPAEVEAALSEHPGVDDVVVIGLPDPEWGHRVHAVLSATDSPDPPGADELRRHCRERLAAYKVPKSFEVVPELPRTEAGKISRSALAEERSATSAP